MLTGAPGALAPERVATQKVATQKVATQKVAMQKVATRRRTSGILLAKRLSRFYSARPASLAAHGAAWASSHGMAMSKTDWTATLRKIERQFDGLPTPPSRVSSLSRRIAERRTMERKERLGAAVGTLVRLSLVILLAGGINFWPYPHSCGVGLYTFLGAESLIIIGALWAVIWTWEVRAALAHSVSLALVLWGIVLLALQVLPRVGYAKTVAPVAWSCSAPSPHAAS